jgi:transmembrane sensor
MGPMSGMAASKERGPDPVLEQAMDWLLRVEAAPGDACLRAAAQAWATSDEAHAAAWALARKTWTLTGQTQPVHAEDWIPAAPPTPAPSLKRSLWRRRVVPAALALAACLALVLAAPALLLSLAADHLTGAGETRDIVLDDGSVVHLGADSAISIAFTPERRAVELLEGEAYFEVVPDASRPFMVGAADFTVTVTGTAFDVGITARSLSVAVAEGRVRVAPFDEGGATPVELRPGDRLTVDRRTGGAVLASVPPGDVAAWRQGRLIAEDVAFADVVEAIGRYHPGAIVVADDSLNEHRMTGAYDLDDPVRALRALAGPYGARVREITPYLIVVSAY